MQTNVYLITEGPCYFANAENSEENKIVGTRSHLAMRRFTRPFCGEPFSVSSPKIL